MCFRMLPGFSGSLAGLPLDPRFLGQIYHRIDPGQWVPRMAPGPRVSRIATGPRAPSSNAEQSPQDVTRSSPNDVIYR